MEATMSATAKAKLAQEDRETPYTERARFFDSSNAFAIKYPDVPRHIFLLLTRQQENNFPTIYHYLSQSPAPYVPPRAVSGHHGEHSAGLFF